MMKLLYLALFVAIAVARAPLLDVLEEKYGPVTEKELDNLCDNINHGSHSLWSPLRCVKGEVDHAASGTKFLETHTVDAANLNPVILLPGLGGSSLTAQVHKNDTPAWYCFKNWNWFRIWFAVQELLVQPCWLDNLDVDFDPVSGNYSNTPGVAMIPTDFGGITGVAYLDYKLGLPVKLTSIYADVIASLERIGYKPGQNLRGAPYDWRWPATYTEKIGWYNQLQTLIETTSAANGNKPVHIITHSMGGPTALYFLNSRPQSWLNQYVASFIPVAGPWTGAPNALRAVLSGDNFGLSIFGIDLLSKKGLRNIARKSGGIISLVPNRLYFNLTSPRGIVSLIPNTDINTADLAFVNVQGTNYSITSFPTLLTAVIDSPITGTVYSNVQTIVESLHAPQVPVHCVYGYGVDTEHFYSYPKGNFDKDPVVFNDDGDGTVPLYSLQECQTWANTQSAPVEIKEFHLRGHGAILHDDEFLQYLLTVVSAGATSN